MEINKNWDGIWRCWRKLKEVKAPKLGLSNKQEISLCIDQLKTTVITISTNTSRPIRSMAFRAPFVDPLAMPWHILGPHFISPFMEKKEILVFHSLTWWKDMALRILYSANFIKHYFQVWLWFWDLNLMYTGARGILVIVFFKTCPQGSSSFSFHSCLPSGWIILLLSGIITIISEKIFLDPENFWPTFAIHFTIGLACFCVSSYVMYMFLLPFRFLSLDFWDILVNMIFCSWFCLLFCVLIYFSSSSYRREKPFIRRIIRFRDHSDWTLQVRFCLISTKHLIRPRWLERWQGNSLFSLYNVY